MARNHFIGSIRSHNICLLSALSTLLSIFKFFLVFLKSLSGLSVTLYDRRSLKYFALFTLEHRKTENEFKQAGFWPSILSIFLTDITYNPRTCLPPGTAAMWRPWRPQSQRAGASPWAWGVRAQARANSGNTYWPLIGGEWSRDLNTGV